MDAYPDLYQGIPDVFTSKPAGGLVNRKLEAQGLYAACGKYDLQPQILT